MTVTQLIEKELFTLCEAGDTSRSIDQIFCCDLLSIAMAKCPSGAAWITVMSNINTLAVATLTDASCIVLAEDVAVEETFLTKAKEERVTVFKTELSIFQAGLQIQDLMMCL